MEVSATSSLSINGGRRLAVDDVDIQEKCAQLDLENKELRHELARLKEQLALFVNASSRSQPCSFCGAHDVNESGSYPPPPTSPASASTATGRGVAPVPARQCSWIPPAPSDETTRLNLVLDSVKLGTWDWKPQTNELAFNQHWKKMLGYEEHELDVSEETWRGLMHPDELDDASAKLKEHLEGVTPVFSVEHRMQHKDGHWVWVLNTGKVVEWDGEGKPLRAAGIHQDISARKKLEEELTAALAASQSANKAKSAFLANMSHEIRTPMAGILGAGVLLLDTALSREQRELAVMMVESTRLLLSIVNDILDLSKIEEGFLRLEAAPINLDELLDHVHKLFSPKAREKGIEIKVAQAPPRRDQAQRWFLADPTRLRQILLNLVGNAVKFTHEGSVTVTAELSAHDDCQREEARDGGEHAAILNDMQEMRVAWDAGSEATMSPAMTDASGDEDQDATARSSRGNNSGLTRADYVRDASCEAAGCSSGGRLVDLRMPDAEGGMTDADDGCQQQTWDLRIQIRDTGIGMSRDMVEHVFDRFQQADGSITRNYGGSGLGTTISKELAKRMGGDVTVVSEEGKGSTFTLFLPVKRSQAAGTPTSSSLTSAAAVAVQGFSPRAAWYHPSRDYGLTAILAEDNSLNRRILEKILRTLGIRIIPACNGRQAVDLAQSGVDHDLIFMDIQMPECDGVTATGILRAQGYLRPIVAITANVMESDQQIYIAAGMNATLPKPYSRSQICEEIDRLLLTGALTLRDHVGEPDMTATSDAPDASSSSHMIVSAPTAGCLPSLERKGKIRRLSMESNT